MSRFVVVGSGALHARWGWALGFGSVDALLFFAFVGALGAWSARGAAEWVFGSLVWASCVVGAFWALRFARDLPRVDGGAAVALVAAGTFVGALIGAAVLVVLAMANGGGGVDEWAFVAFGAVYAVFFGGAVGFLCALLDVAVLGFVQLARGRRKV